MSEVSYYVPGPYEGISQVPPQVRLQGACKDMLNCTSILPFGVSDRPPLEWLGVITSLAATAGSPKWTSLPRATQADDLALILYEHGGIHTHLHKLSTGEHVNFTITYAAAAYLNSGSPNPSDDLMVTAVEDTIFITNRKVTVGLSAATAPTRPYEALLWCKTGGYGREFKVTITPAASSGIDPVTASYATANGGLAPQAAGVSTDAIIDGLLTGTVIVDSDAIVSGDPLSTLSSAGFTVDKSGALLLISHPTVDFKITIADGGGGQSLTAVKQSVQRFSDLPELAIDGFTVRIAQEVTGGHSDYWVRFNASKTLTTGVWEETLAPGAPLGLDPATMPLAATYDPVTSTWTLDVPAWGIRTVGDLALCPDPSFVGDTIEDIAWLAGRLVLIASGSQYLSASDDPYRFYPATLTVSLDSDPFGRLPPDSGKVHFKAAITVDKRLVVFADKHQTVMDPTGIVVSPTTLEIASLARLPYSAQVPLQEVAGRLYFTNNTSGHTRVYEYAPDPVSGRNQPSDMTIAVPTLLPRSINHAAASQELYTSVYGTLGLATLYVNTYRYDKEQRLQNSWNVWELPEGFTYAGAIFRGTTLHLLLEGPQGGYRGCTVDMTPGQLDTDGKAFQRLDLRVSEAACTISYDSGGDRTTITLPNSIPVDPTTILSVRGPGTTTYPETTVPSHLARNENSVTVAGDFRGVPFWVGRPFRAFFEPTRWFAYDQSGRILAGRLTLRRAVMDVDGMSQLQSSVYLAGRAPRITTFEGFNVEDELTPLDATPDEPAPTFTVSIGGTNKQTRVVFSSYSHRGFRVLGYRWFGDLDEMTRSLT